MSEVVDGFAVDVARIKLTLDVGDLELLTELAAAVGCSRAAVASFFLTHALYQVRRISAAERLKLIRTYKADTSPGGGSYQLPLDVAEVMGVPRRARGMDSLSVIFNSLSALTSHPKFRGLP